MKIALRIIFVVLLPCLQSGLRGAEPELPQPRKLPAVPERRPSDEIPPALARFRDTPVTLIDLAAALRLAGVDNPRILEARQVVATARVDRQLAIAQILPALNSGGNYDQHNGPLQQSSGNIFKVNRESLNFGAGGAAVAAGSPVPPGVFYALNVADGLFTYLERYQTVSRTRFASQAVENETLLRVALAYNELVRAAGLRSLAWEGVRLSSAAAAATTERAGKRDASRADAERAIVEKMRQEDDFLEAENQILQTSAQLEAMLNLEPTLRLQPAESSPHQETLVPESLSLPELLALALLHRPELAERRAAIRQTFLALNAARLLPFSPTLLLGFSASEFGGGSDFIHSSIPDQRSGAAFDLPRFGEFQGRNDFDVVFYWTIQNLGLGNRALIQTAGSHLASEKIERLAVLNRVRQEVADAYVLARTRSAQIDVREQAARTAKEAYNRDLQRVRQGRALPIELLDSFHLVAETGEEYLNAILDFNAEQLRLYTAVGQPPAALWKRPPSRKDREEKQSTPAPMARR